MAILSHFSSEKLLGRTEYGCTVGLRMKNGRGTAQIYELCPGGELILLDISGGHWVPRHENRANILEINYHMAGRAEYRLPDGMLLYSGLGDLFFNLESNHVEMVDIPLEFYRGVALILDLDRWEGQLPPWLSHSLIKEGKPFFLHADATAGHIFSVPPNLPEKGIPAWWRLKLEELLLYLRWYDPTSGAGYRIYEPRQAEVAKAVRQELTQALDRRYTIEELAREHYISPGTLKESFKGVYGTSIGSYMKHYRIQRAGELLRDTDLSVAEVAAAVGYRTQSKLGQVFKEATGKTPSEYRRERHKAAE